MLALPAGSSKKLKDLTEPWEISVDTEKIEPEITHTELQRLRPVWLANSKQQLSHFKQFFTHFNTLFYSHVYQKHSNNFTQTN